MLDLLKRATGSTKRPASMPASGEQVRVEEYAAAFQFRAKAGAAVVLAGRPAPAEVLPGLFADLAVSPVEVMEPRDAAFADAAPSLERPEEARQWLDAHAAGSPVGRHAIIVLESVGAADLALDTLVCALVDGDLDPDGYPGPDAIVGGFASRWDPVSGDLVVRPVVGWGGRGARAAADRTATGLLGALAERLSSAGRTDAPAAAPDQVDEDAAAARVCPHCGFQLAGERALFCPKCGMRMRSH